MIHEILPVGLLQCNCSILGDETSREAIVVDPGDDIPAIQAIFQRHGLAVQYIVITHAHIDHIAGAHRLKLLTGAPILYNQNDLPLVKMMDVQASWLRVPTPDVSVVMLSANVQKKTTAAEVNAAFCGAAEGALKGILAVSDEPLVSTDYIGNLASSTVDLQSTNVVDGTLVNVTAWYDNEMGYSARCVDLLRYIGAK